MGFFLLLIALVFLVIYQNKQKFNKSKSASEYKSNISTKKYEYSVEPADDFTDDYIVFDLETTGLDSFSDEIIEIGALKYKNNILIDTFHEFVKPSTSISKYITDITGIANEDVKNSKNIKEILPTFISFIEDFILIAHNNSFDLKFIMQNLKNQNIPCIKNKTIDTLSLSKEYLPDLKNHKLETLKHFLNMQNVSHRALSDCEITNAVYQYCKMHNSKETINNIDAPNIFNKKVLVIDEKNNEKEMKQFCQRIDIDNKNLVLISKNSYDNNNKIYHKYLDCYEDWPLSPEFSFEKWQIEKIDNLYGYSECKRCYEREYRKRHPNAKITGYDFHYYYEDLC